MGIPQNERRVDLQAKASIALDHTQLRFNFPILIHLTITSRNSSNGNTFLEIKQTGGENRSVVQIIIEEEECEQVII